MHAGPRYEFHLPSATQHVLSLEGLVPGAWAWGWVGRRWLSGERLRAAAAGVTTWMIRVPVHGAWLVAGYLSAWGVVYTTEAYGIPDGMLTVGSSTPEDREALLQLGHAWLDRMVAMGEVAPDQRGALTPYQVRGVAWSATRPFTFDIWTTGSGKTREGTLAAMTRDGAILILGPAVCRRAWAIDVPQCSQLELHRVLPKSERGRRYEDIDAYLTRMRRDGRRPIVVAGYEAISEYVDELQVLQPATLVFDEFQVFASPERFECCRDQDGKKRFEPRRTKEGNIARNVLASQVSRWGCIQQRIGLTAQPLDDGAPWRFYALLDLLDPDGWGTRRNFEVRYADGHEEGTRWIKSGKSNLAELRQRARFFTHEVTPSEAAQYLPPLRVEVCYLDYHELSAPGAFAKEIAALDKLARGHDEDSEAAVAAREAKLALAATRKRGWVFRMALEALASGQKVVIFVERLALAATWFGQIEPMVRRLTNVRAAQARVFLATGETSDAERGRILTLWSTLDEPALLIATGQSMGVSKDGLQHTDLAIQAQLPPRPGDLVQRRGRFARLGGRACRYMIPIAPGTYDEDVAHAVARKTRVLKEMMVAEELDGLDRKLLGVEDIAAIRRQVLASLGITVPE